MRKNALKYGELSSSLVANGLIVGISATCSRLDTRVLLLESSVPITAEMGAVRFWTSKIKSRFDVPPSFCLSNSSLR